MKHRGLYLHRLITGTGTRNRKKNKLRWGGARVRQNNLQGEPYKCPGIAPKDCYSSAWARLGVRLGTGLGALPCKLFCRTRGGVVPRGPRAQITSALPGDLDYE